MGDAPDPPAPPDYGPIAASDARIAQMQYDLGREQLDWAKEQYRTNKGTADRVIDSALEVQDMQSGNASRAQDFYDTTYRPIEADFAAEVNDYASPARQEQEAGRAGAAVDASFNGARTQASNRLAAMGIDPSQVRAGALDAQMSTVQAAQRAGAMNTARLATEQTGLQLQSTAINVGRGYPGAVAGTFGSATNAGSVATNAGNSTTATGASAMGTATPLFNAGNQASSNGANALSQGYNAQLGSFNAQQNSSSGWGSLLGAGVGLAGSAAMMFAAEGGGIPLEASPSGGENVDDVPIMANAGEFIVPKDVVAYEGMGKLHAMVRQARKKMGLPEGASAATAGQRPRPPTGIPMGGHGAMGNMQSIGLPV